jgi:hypothetical protein
MDAVYQQHLFRPGRDRVRAAFLIRLKNQLIKGGTDADTAGCQAKAYAWELLHEVVRHTPSEGSDWTFWGWREPGPIGPSGFLQEILDIYNRLPKRPPADFDTFEMVHLDPMAKRHASERMLSIPQREKAAKLGWRYFQEFPPDSVALKTVWRRIPQNSCIALGVWDDPDAPITPGPYFEDQWNRHVLVYDSVPGRVAPSSCGQAASRTRQTDLRLRAQDHFVWMRVSNSTHTDRFKALLPAGGDLKSGDLLILAGMHISRKDVPDWAWATTYWKGKTTGPTVQETAGRDEVFSASSVWSNYVLKFALSFQYPCALPDCRDGRRTFVYNPYLEAGKLLNGTASNCIACHAKARYVRGSVAADRSDVPDQFGGDLNLFRFEGTTMTDYSWTAGKK